MKKIRLCCQCFIEFLRLGEAAVEILHFQDSLSLTLPQPPVLDLSEPSREAVHLPDCPHCYKNNMKHSSVFTNLLNQFPGCRYVHVFFRGAQHNGRQNANKWLPSIAREVLHLLLDQDLDHLKAKNICSIAVHNKNASRFRRSELLFGGGVEYLHTTLTQIVPRSGVFGSL